MFYNSILQFKKELEFFAEMTESRPRAGNIQDESGASYSAKTVKEMLNNKSTPQNIMNICQQETGAK